MATPCSENPPSRRLHAQAAWSGSSPATSRRRRSSRRASPTRGATPPCCWLGSSHKAARHRCRPHSHRGCPRFCSQTRVGRYCRARYYHPQLQRFISQDPVGVQDGDNLYAYVGGNPLARVDPFGLSWEYSQSSGMLIHVDDESGIKTAEGWGYAGAGEGLNNPAMQHVRDLGPLPQGSYTIGPQRENVILVRNQRVKLPGSMRLTPTGDTNLLGRTGGFLIHGGDYESMASSQGCIVLPPQIRNRIGHSGDNVLRVVP